MVRALALLSLVVVACTARATPDAAPHAADAAPPAADARCETSSTGQPTCEGGASCTLGDGEAGRCTSLTTCCALGTRDDDCAGAVCRTGSHCQAYRCVYATCDALASDQPCNLAGGGVGVCCGGACRAIDLQNDPDNCGFCGEVCPTLGGDAPTCSGGLCFDRCYACDPGTCGACPAGYDCHAPGCAIADCAGHDGVVCRLPATPSGYGFCSGGVCTQPPGN